MTTNSPTEYCINWDVEDSAANTVLLTIQNGPYEGITYFYTVVDLDIDDDPPKLKFEYVITDNPQGHEVDEDVDFHNTIGDILQDCITQTITDDQHDN